MNPSSRQEALASLRKAWTATHQVEKLIQQMLINPNDAVVMEGLLILAAEHVEQAKQALNETAGKISLKE